MIFDREILDRIKEIQEQLVDVKHRQMFADFNLGKIAQLLVEMEYRRNAAVAIELTQDGEQMGQINGTAIGGTSTFTAAFLQASGAAGTLQANSIPQWTSTDTNVTITQSADGTQASVALAAAEANTNYPLTITAVNSDGVTITQTFSIPVLPAVVVPPPPPPDTAATSITLTQNS